MSTTKTTKSATIDGVSEHPEPDLDAVDRLTGQGGLLAQLAGPGVRVALGAELTDHLGHPPRQAPPAGAGNHCDGSTPVYLLRPGTTRSVRTGVAALESSTFRPSGTAQATSPSLIESTSTLTSPSSSWAQSAIE